MLLKLVAKTILIFLSAYLAFWALATYAEHRAKPVDFGTHSSIQFTPLAASGKPLVEVGPLIAAYKPPYRFISRLWDKKIAGGRVKITVPLHPQDTPLGLMLSARSDVLAVRLNGRLLSADTHSPRLSGAFVSEPALYHLPVERMTHQSDYIEIDIRRSLRDPIIFPDFTVAPLEKLRPAFAWRNFLSVEAPMIGIVLTVFSTIIFVTTASPDTSRFKNFTFVGTLLFSVMASCVFLFFNTEKYSLESYAYITSFATILLGLCAIYYSYNEAKIPYISMKNLNIFICVLSIISIVVALYNYSGTPEHFAIFNLFLSAQLFATGSLIVAAAMLTWDIEKGGATRFIERFLLIICFMAIALDRTAPGLFTVNSPLAKDLPLSLQWMPVIGSLVGFAMIFILAKHAEFARTEVLSANINLERKLSQREAELRDIYASREKILATQATSEERQRIMRDMHDGLGSQLMSMLLAARRGVAKPAAVAEGLQSVIDEMRLLIDSMDSVGESLGSAFAMFRQRVQSRVEAAGMAFKWHDSSEGHLPELGPRDVLQVFRIMQEAVTNALKHSGGTALSVTIAPGIDPAVAIRIGIADNGSGLGMANPRGKGLESMRARAAGINGRLEVQSSEKGVAVLLDLPK